MSVNSLYGRRSGRILLKCIQKLGLFSVCAWYLKTCLSRIHIRSYVRKNKIDMSPFGDTRYRSFAEFFARERENLTEPEGPDVLVSPCDGLLSFYEITPDMRVPMKGSSYGIGDFVPEPETASSFRNGICLIFRLQASDYHHFCAFDDMDLEMTKHIPGCLHSVQPIACETMPVYKLNRRWWSVLHTRNFRTVIQLEVGAMMVGGVSFRKDTGHFKKGEDLGWFEIAGSTVILLMDEGIRKDLHLFPQFEVARDGVSEVPVSYGKGIGVLKTAGNCADIIG